MVNVVLKREREREREKKGMKWKICADGGVGSATKINGEVKGKQERRKRMEEVKTLLINS